GPPPAEGTGVVTFGSLHKLEKLNAEVVELWCRVLQATPGSRLLLCRRELHGATAAYWQGQFPRRGGEPPRLVLPRGGAVGLRPLGVHARIDVALAPFPWNGHPTACEALCMGVPVVALRGRRHAGRMVASVLTAACLPELVAESTEEYQQLAVALALDDKR